MAGDDEGRVDDRLEGHEEDAVREVLDRLGGELESEPRLAGATRPGQGQQPGRCQQPSSLGDLVDAADEAGRQHRQVVRRRVERSQRRKLVRQPGRHELTDPFRAREVLQPMLPEVSQRDAGRQAAFGQGPGRA